MKASTKMISSIATLVVMMYCQFLTAQNIPHQGFVRQVLDETVSSMQEFTGITKEKRDTIILATGDTAIRHLKAITTVYRQSERIFLDLNEVFFDPNQEAPLSKWYGGLADMQGKIRWSIDSSDWTFKILPEYYHPEARYFVATASVHEEYRVHELALIGQDGSIAYMTAAPIQAVFNKERSILACLYPEAGIGSTPAWRLRYRNMDTQQEWERFHYGQRPFMRLIDPLSKGMIYSVGDSLFGEDSNGKLIWESHIDGLSNAGLISGDASQYYFVRDNQPVTVYGKEAKQALYTLSPHMQGTKYFLFMKAVEGTPFALMVSAVNPGVKEIKLFGNSPAGLGEVLVSEHVDALVSGVYRNDKKIIEVFNGNRLVYKWRDGNEGKENQRGPE